MANLSNINNILRTDSLGVGINRDPLGVLEVSSATRSGIKMFNTGASARTYETYVDASGNYIIYDVDADRNDLVINNSGNSTFTGSVRVSNPTQSNYWLYNAAKTNGFLLGRSIGSNDAQDFFIFDTISNSARLQINSVGDITFSNQATFGGDITIYEPAGNAAIILSGGAANNETYQIAQGVTGISNGGFSIRNIAENKDVMVFQDVTGNVGIGTNSPQQLLHINEAGNTTKPGIQVQGGVFGFTLGKAPQSADYVHLKPLGSGISVLRVMPNTSSSTSYIEAWGTDYEADTNNWNRIYMNVTGSSGNATITTDSSGTGAVGNLYLGTNSNQQTLTILDSGNVGIGQTAPGQKLVIGNYDSVANGTMRITALGGQSIGVIRSSLEFALGGPTYVNPGDAWKFSIGLNSAVGNQGNYASDFVIRRTTRLGVTDNVDFMIDGTSGNVGIGTDSTDSPSAKLDVVGSIAAGTRNGGVGYKNQLFQCSKTATGSGVGIDVMFVGHTNALNITVMCIIDGAQAAVGVGTMCVAYGAASGGLTSTRVSGNFTSVSVAYVNSGGSESYILRVTPTYGGSSNPTIYLSAQGQSNILLRTAV